MNKDDLFDLIGEDEMEQVFDYLNGEGFDISLIEDPFKARRAALNKRRDNNGGKFIVGDFTYVLNMEDPEKRALLNFIDKHIP